MKVILVSEDVFQTTRACERADELQLGLCDLFVSPHQEFEWNCNTMASEEEERLLIREIGWKIGFIIRSLYHGLHIKELHTITWMTEGYTIKGNTSLRWTLMTWEKEQVLQLGPRVLGHLKQNLYKLWLPILVSFSFFWRKQTWLWTKYLQATQSYNQPRSKFHKTCFVYPRQYTKDYQERFGKYIEWSLSLISCREDCVKWNSNLIWVPNAFVVS